LPESLKLKHISYKIAGECGEEVPTARGASGVRGLPPLGRAARYTLHPAAHTLQPTPYTLQPTPYTLHPAAHTLHPTVYTRPYPTPKTTLQVSAKKKYPPPAVPAEFVAFHRWAEPLAPPVTDWYLERSPRRLKGARLFPSWIGPSAACVWGFILGCHPGVLCSV